jgi:hypothetical protein
MKPAFFLAVVGCALCPLGHALQAQDKAAPEYADISGVYLVSGKDGQKSYAGAVVIRQLGEVYFAQYAVGGTSTLGIGVRLGDRLSVGWVQAEGKMTRGVTVYTVKGKRLDGRWATLPTSGVVHSETLTWLAALPADETDD